MGFPNTLQYSNMNIQIRNDQEYPENPVSIIRCSRISVIGGLFSGLLMDIHEYTLWEVGYFGSLQDIGIF